MVQMNGCAAEYVCCRQIVPSCRQKTVEMIYTQMHADDYPILSRSGLFNLTGPMLCSRTEDVLHLVSWLLEIDGWLCTNHRDLADGLQGGIPWFSGIFS